MFSIDVGYHYGYFRMDEDEGLKHMKWKEALELVSLYFADPQLVLSKYQHWLDQSPFNRSNFFFSSEFIGQLCNIAIPLAWYEKHD